MSTKDTVLALFEKNKGFYVSGERIASELNISRTAVWKAVKKLQREGYEIKAVTNRGYCLDKDADVLSAHGIRSFFGSRILCRSGFFCRHFCLCRRLFLDSCRNCFLCRNRLRNGNALFRRDRLRSRNTLFNRNRLGSRNIFFSGNRLRNRRGLCFADSRRFRRSGIVCGGWPLRIASLVSGGLWGIMPTPGAGRLLWT